MRKFSFRPMEISALDDPSIEAGDVVYVVDDHGNTYPTIVSNIEYSIGDYEKFSADAESESTKQSVNYDVETKAVQSAKEITISGISTYEVQTFNFVNMAAYAMGLYATKQQAADGSYILYWHDKQVLSSSSNVWKLDENSFTVSIDGGTTWKSIDNSTNIISYLLNILGVYTSINNKLPINSPQMTGIPTAPTAADGTHTTQIATTAFVISEISKLVPATGSPLDSYPVGSFYWSSESTSPASLFGGSWERIEDIFVLAAGPLHPLGSSGGEASHTLTEAEIPNHRHVGLFGKGVNQSFWESGGSAWCIGGSWSGESGDYTTGYTGGGQAHNTMPPYMAANCWHRIA
mgnify:FL=1